MLCFEDIDDETARSSTGTSGEDLARTDLQNTKQKKIKKADRLFAISYFDFVCLMLFLLRYE